MHGREDYHRPSRFLHEISPEMIEEIRFRTKVSRPTPVKNSFTPQSQGRFRIGQEVKHRIFGNGIIIDTEGDGDDMKVRVRFEQTGVGTKQLIASYLEPV